MLRRQPTQIELKEEDMAEVLELKIHSYSAHFILCHKIEQRDTKQYHLFFDNDAVWTNESKIGASKATNGEGRARKKKTKIKV